MTPLIERLRELVEWNDNPEKHQDCGYIDMPIKPADARSLMALYDAAKEGQSELRRRNRMSYVPATEYVVNKLVTAFAALEQPHD